MQRRQRRGKAFTLIELLVVIVIIMVLIGILMPALYGTKKQAKQNQARAEIKALEAAIMNYKFSEREWPSGTTHNRDVIIGASAGPRTSYRVLNYNTFVDALMNASPPYVDDNDFLIVNKKILDPWRMPYVVCLDSDYDGELLVPSAGSKPGDYLYTNVQGIAIWSYGPDKASSWPDEGKKNVREDDIRSWSE